MARWMLAFGVLAMCASCTVGLHFPRHHTVGVRPLRLGRFANKATTSSVSIEAAKTAGTKAKAAVTVRTAGITVDFPRTGGAADVAVLEALIAQEREHIAHCRSDEECVVHEAALLRDQLQAFLDSPKSKLRAWSEQVNALALRTLRARVHGIVQRRHALVERAK